MCLWLLCFFITIQKVYMYLSVNYVMKCGAVCFCHLYYWEWTTLICDFVIVVISVYPETNVTRSYICLQLIMGCKIITLALLNLCFRNENCNKLTDYIKSLPTYKCPRAKSGGQFLELPTVKRIEKIVDRMAKSKFKHQTVTVKPGLIYKVK